ncbi:MAG: transcriptional regulator [Myxococcaceae bacterium]|nr:transcriptional regulator [Myxococcaceae bacterium]
MFHFGDFTLDLQLYQLRLGNQVVPLEPKVFDVLRYLVEHHDRVATKRELLDSLWPNEVVSDAVLPTNINTLRRALGQARGDKTPIETVHGRGYRFSMPVRRAPISSTPASMFPAPASLRPAELREVVEPLVGQAPLLEKLTRLLSLSLAEQGQVCILTGEAGIGKTRVARYVAELARAQGADVWLGSCDQARDLPPLWPFQQVLRSALQSEGPEALRRWLGPLALELGNMLPVLADARDPRPARAGREHESFGVFDALIRVLTQASRARPRVLWLEDMHRADEASWQLLRLLAPHLERASVLVLVTVRSRDDLTVVLPVQRNLELLQRVPQCHRFLVRGLEVAQVGELAAKLFEAEVSPELASALHDKTGGNPLFVRELVDWLEVRGGSDAAALRDSPNLAPSELVRHVLRRRVVRLGALAQKLLEASAVVGSSWDAGLVERATSLPHDACADAIDTALTHRVIVPVPGRVDAYRFAHDLVRDTLYSDLPTRERRRLHLRVATALDERIAWLGLDGVREVAHHLYAALPEGDPEHAIRSLEQAAERCEECGDYRDAAQFYRLALDAARLLPVADPELAHALNSSQERAAVLARGARVQS